VIDIGLHRLQIRILLVLCIPSANCTKNRNHKAAIVQHNRGRPDHKRNENENEKKMKLQVLQS